MKRAQAIPDAITVHVPFSLVKRGGRKEIVLPTAATALRKKDDNLVKALARAFRWKRMLESRQFATTEELAKHEKIAVTYMTRMLRLTLLAPAVVEDILEGRQHPNLKLAKLVEPLPSEWSIQDQVLSDRMGKDR